jgi:hypothetical protein
MADYSAYLSGLGTSPSGGMFGGGGKFGIGQALVAALNGYLAGTGNPVGMANLQMMQQMRQRQQDHQQSIDDYNRKRADDNTDWMTQYNYKLTHPEQTDDQYTRALEASGVKPGTPEYAQHMAARAAILENPPRYEMVNGALVQVGGPSAQQPAPVAPVGKLKPYYPGGQTGAPSGGFPY